jgi:glutamine cyclotransferase
MQKKPFLFLLAFTLLAFILSSCADDNEPGSLRSSFSSLKFSSPRSGEKFTFGDTIHFDLKLIKESNKIVESLGLYINGELIHEEKASEMLFDYPTTAGSGGSIKIKGVVKFSDGTNSRRRMEISVLSDRAAEKMTYQLVNSYPHDVTSYTQGLIYDSKEGLLFEGTGNYSESKLLKIKVGDEKAKKEIPISDQYFGEGITMLHDTIFQLTYKNKKGFYYDREFNLLGEFTYPSEGWGLTTDGTSLIMSDGSATLFYLNPHSFEIKKSIQVFNDKGLMYNINELEYVDGIIYANIYQTDFIAKIDAHSGQLLGLINMKGILDKNLVEGRIDVLNGIAYNPQMNTFYVTGKWWPRLFEVRFVKE